MSEILKRITKKVLSVCPDINITENEHYQFIIEPKNENGFGIYLDIDERENTVHFDSFHFHFDKSEEGEEDLLSYIGYALSNHSRLKIYSKGNKEFKWKFEVQEENRDKWISSGTTALLYFNPFKKTVISYRQNDWIDMDRLGESTSG